MLILTNPSDHQLLRQIILRGRDPIGDVEKLLGEDGVAVVSLKNDAPDAADQTKRRDAFAEIRAIQMDTLQQRPSESETEFALRRGIVSSHLDELERLLAEAANAVARFYLEKEPKIGRVKFSSTGIPETSYAESLALFGSTPDAFAAVKTAEDAVLTVRINHPVDELRQKNSHTILDLMGRDAKHRISSTNNLSASEKAASEKLIDGLVQIARDTVSGGWFNGLMETRLDADGEFVGYAAATIVDGKRLNDTLALISETGKDNTIEKSVATVGDVTIHRVSLAEGYLEAFDRLFGAGHDAYIGVSDDIVWIATGPDALTALKAAIGSVGEPQKAEHAISINGHLRPWAKRLLSLAEGLPKPSTADGMQQRRDRIQRLKDAVEALQSDDAASFVMTVEDGKATGEIEVALGMLRFIGSQVARFSRETLAE